MKTLIRYFVQGLLLLVPLVITAFVVYKIISFIASIFASFGIIVHPVVDFFIVGVVAILLIFLVGFMGSSIIFKPLFSLFEVALEKAPVIKIVYSAIKDFLSAFVGKKKRFNRPVLVDIDKANGIQQMGFITQDSLALLGLPEGKAAVYFPFSYAFTGKLLFVPSENITLLTISSAEAMKFIVSGGVTEIE